MRIYIESTIPSYIVARPSRDPLQAALQKVTREWWERRRHAHELFASLLVIEEISKGEPAMARKRVAVMNGVAILRSSDATEALAEKIHASGLLPKNADQDCAHIALATTNRLDVLLTWNCRHIANPAIQARLRDLASSLGYSLPLLCTPASILGDMYEEVE